MKSGATLHTIAPFSYAAFPSYILSRSTESPESMRLNARVVGIFKKCMASLQRNSRIELLNTANPSAPLEKGVGPAPFN